MLVFVFTPSSALQGWTQSSRSISVDSLLCNREKNPAAWCHLPPNDTYNVVTMCSVKKLTAAPAATNDQFIYCQLKFLYLQNLVYKYQTII